MSRYAWASIWGVLLTGIAVSGLALRAPAPSPALWVTCAALIVPATVAQLFKAEAPHHVLFYASPVFFFAGALLLPPSLIVPLVVIPHIVEWVRERWRRGPHLRAWYLQPFNMAMYSIALVSAHAVALALSKGVPIALTPTAVLVVTLSALVYLVLNHGLLAAALMLARGVSWRESGLRDIETHVSEFIMLYVGAVVAVLWHSNPWMILPAVSPLALMYRTLTIPRLKQEAQTDAKTGVFNARHFDTLFRVEFERAQRFNRPLAFVMADLDFLRDINNVHGHLAGDAVLGRIGRVIHATVRDYDIVGRFGGEEFAIVLPETGVHDAGMLAERIRQAVAAERFEVATSTVPIGVTMSLGVACYPSHADAPTALVETADAAVYQAKATGRDRVHVAANPASIVAEIARTDGHADEGESRDAIGPAPADLTDRLTGLGTQRALVEELQRAVARARRLGEPIAVARVAIDQAGLAEAQREGGRPAALLVGVVAAALNRGRDMDRAFRLDDDDFAIILPRTTLDDAVCAVERVRADVARTLSGVTVDAGVADLTADVPGADALLERAGIALGWARQSQDSAVVIFDRATATVPLASSA